MLDLLYPAMCFLCKKHIAQSGLCAECFAQIQPINTQVCKQCALPMATPVFTRTRCAKCIQTSPSFDETYALWQYDNFSKPLILGLKYSNRIHLGYWLATLLYPKIPKLLANTDIIMPVPLTWNHFFIRGYNQTVYIAAPLAKLCKAPFAPLALTHKGYRSQKQKSRKARQKITANQFSCNINITGKIVWVVDDVMTTGSTLNAIAHTLKKCNAKQVMNIVAFRAVD